MISVILGIFVGTFISGFLGFKLAQRLNRSVQKIEPATSTEVSLIPLDEFQEPQDVHFSKDAFYVPEELTTKYDH